MLEHERSPGSARARRADPDLTAIGRDRLGESAGATACRLREPGDFLPGEVATGGRCRPARAASAAAGLLDLAPHVGRAVIAGVPGRGDDGLRAVQLNVEAEAFIGTDALRREAAHARPAAARIQLELVHDTGAVSEIQPIR